MRPSLTPPTLYETFVPGRPAPQGSKRIVRGRMIEQSPHHKRWRATVHQHAVLTHRVEPLSGPLSLSLTFWLQRPARDSKFRRTVPSKRPDASKLARSVEDALVTAQVMHDDAQIVDLHVYKRYVHPPSLRRSLEPDETGVSISLASVADAW